MSYPSHSRHGAGKPGMIALGIAAIGVVFGDIGTSPLYAFREALHAVSSHEDGVTRDGILGLLSLILWSMTLIVTCKYVVMLMKIDNKGEGGTLALMALARSVIYLDTRIFLYLGIIGAALFYGDSMITPAISVLSAVEGFKTVTPVFDPYVIPLTVAILVVLFACQSRGTASVSKIFGPVMVLWFAVLGILGAMHISDDLDIFNAINPYYALKFLFNHGTVGMLTMGAVFLAVTGAEALYADLGHFGRLPIQGAWGWFVFPCLTLNYLGQGAMVLADPSTMDNPFFLLAPEEFKLPLVLLATFATIVASQAVITGAYSLTRQAMNLGLLPHLHIKHTSVLNSGQIYMPQVNYMLMFGAIILVMAFQSSSALAATYGISVAGTMLVGGVMAFFVVWQIWEWPWWKTALVVGPFIVIESVFFAANMLKIASGGWVSLMIAAALTVLMLVWLRGSGIIASRSFKRDMKLRKFITAYHERWPGLARVSGTAFFMASNPEIVPASLTQNLTHNKVLHEKNILMTVQMDTAPYVEAAQRYRIEKLNDDFTQLIVRYGFKEDIDLQSDLIRLSRRADNDLTFDWAETSLFVSRRSLRTDPRYGLPAWQDLIYAFLHRHASEPTDFYRLPASRVIEVGRQTFI